MHDDLVLMAFEKNSALEEKFSINNFDDKFNYETALLEAKKGNHYALAQLGKFYYKSDKPRALLYFDAAIKKDNTIEYNTSNNLIYQVASYLPADEQKKIGYYLIGLQKRLSSKPSFHVHPLPISSSGQREYDINEKEMIEAIAFLLGHTNKKSNFVALMLMILNSPHAQDNALNYSHAIGIALKAAGYYPSKMIGSTKIGYIDTGHDRIYFRRASEEFFALIENYPQSFQDIICRLSKDELNQIIKNHYPDNLNRFQKWHINKFNTDSYLFQYQNRIAEEICMHQILNPDSDIEKSKDYIFKLHLYHDDYKNGIDSLVNEKLQKYMQEGEKIDQEMKMVLDTAEESAQHMLRDLETTITRQIQALQALQALQAKLGIEIIETDDIKKPVKKATQEERILQIQLGAFYEIESKLKELSMNPTAPFNPSSSEDSPMPPGYSDKPIQGHFEKVQTIAKCIKIQNINISRQFEKLNREPIEWWKGVGLFVASLPILVLPIMLYSKKYLHTYQFWNLQKIALKSKEAKIFSENKLFNTVVKHVKEKKQTIKKIDDTKKSLFFSARKLDKAPPSYESPKEKRQKK